MRLLATGRSTLRSHAFETADIPPAPIGASSRYRPLSCMPTSVLILSCPLWPIPWRTVRLRTWFRRRGVQPLRLPAAARADRRPGGPLGGAYGETARPDQV